MVVAVDGYSSTGKSTVAKLIAKELGLVYIDTGAMYRAVTYFALKSGLFNGDKVDEASLQRALPTLKIHFEHSGESGKSETWLNNESVESEIRGMEVSNGVSVIASIPFVRRFLVEQQQRMGNEGNVIMDGRDIGTVVFPNADVKFFMTASPQVRAKRRYDELIAKGDSVTYEEVEKNVITRDYIDSHRSVSPLVQAEDAIVIDNGDMTIEQEVAFMVSVIKEHCDVC
ncbi:MAG: (d)CMP kinase [Marinifilaceae bacterium]|nr:(d)CMP kinase [Marinifilaceae bacterium]